MRLLLLFFAYCFSPSHRSLIFVPVNKFNMLRRTFFCWLSSSSATKSNSKTILIDICGIRHVILKFKAHAANLIHFKMLKEAFNVKFYCDSRTARAKSFMMFINIFCVKWMCVKDVWKTILIVIATSTIIKIIFKTKQVALHCTFCLSQAALVRLFNIHSPNTWML